MRNITATATTLMIVLVSIPALAQGPEPKTAAEEIAEKQAAAKQAAAAKAIAEAASKTAPIVSKPAKTLEELAESGSQWARQRLSAKADAATVVERAPAKAVRTTRQSHSASLPSRPRVQIRNTHTTTIAEPIRQPTANIIPGQHQTISVIPKKAAQPKSMKTRYTSDSDGSKSVFTGSSKPAASTPGPIAGIGAAIGFMLKLALVLALAYLSIVALKFYWSRTGKPLRFGTRALVVEESAPLGAGTAVHLVNINNKRFLVGTAQGQVNILAALDEDGEIKSSTGGSKESDDQTQTDSPFTKFTTDNPTMSAFASVVPMMAEAFKKRRVGNQGLPTSSSQPLSTKSLANDIRKSTQFLDELRKRLDSEGAI